jgi:TonB family protein
MVLTLLIPTLAVLGSLEWAGAVGVRAPAAVIPLVPLAVAVERGGSGLSLDAVLLLGWVFLGVSSLSYLYWMHGRVERAGATGRRARVNGVGVVVTRGMGPAVYGLKRTSILVPEWALGMDARFRRLMLLHEGEHARAGDGRLVLGGLLLAAAVPWNVALWWQLGRLRAAVELDCDERVLRRVRDPLNYGGLLLEVGRRRSGPVLGVALAERTTLLEVRLRRITQAARQPRVRRALWLGGAAVVLLGVAAFTRDPGSSPGRPADAGAQQDTSSLSRAPVFTPFTVAPRLLNNEEVARLMERSYPPLLRDAGIGGEVVLWFLIDETGALRKTQVNQSSGYPALDQAAVSVASAMRFTPAMNRDRVVPVWVSIPIRFTPRGKQPAPPVSERPVRTLERGVPPAPGRTAPVSRSQLEQAPAFTPFTVAPRLINGEETAQALSRSYPPLLRDAGIGGEVGVWFLIDEQGEVRKTQVSTSSGYSALDDAALRVAGLMRFTPARNRDEVVEVWVSIPIKFNTK